jgi:hypothetical protein
LKTATFNISDINKRLENLNLFLATHQELPVLAL